MLLNYKIKVLNFNHLTYSFEIICKLSIDSQIPSKVLQSIIFFIGNCQRIHPPICDMCLIFCENKRREGKKLIWCQCNALIFNDQKLPNDVPFFPFPPFPVSGQSNSNLFWVQHENSLVVGHLLPIQWWR